MSSDNDSNNDQPKKFSFVEIGIFVPILTVAIYISLSIYFLMYFRTIGLEQNLLNLNLDFYLINGIYPISVVIITFFLILTSANYVNFLSRTPLFICSLILASWIFPPNEAGVFPTPFFISALLLFIFVMLSFPWLGPASHAFTTDSIAWKMFSIIIFLFICIVFSIAIGQYMGNQFISGDSSEAVKVHFNFVNDSTHHFSNEIQNETLLLITYRENCYYVVPMNKTRLKHNDVYIIPDQEVVSAHLERIH